MTRVKVKQLEAGQQLREDSFSTNGRLLLKSGTTIEAKHLEIFRTWGVVEVDIVGDELKQDEPGINYSALSSEIKKEIFEKLKQQFRRCNSRHPLIKELIEYQKNRLIKEYLDEEKNPA